MKYENNDYELIYLIKEENEVALDIMFKKYEPLIRKIAGHYFYLFENKMSLEELIQEFRISLYQALISYKTSSDIMFYTYFLYILKSKINELYKYYHRKKRNFATLELEENSIVNYDEPLKLTMTNEFVDMLIKFKNDIDFKDANILEMRFNNFSYKEISLFLEIPIKEVDNRIQKIRKKLKQYILGYDKKFFY